MEGHTSLVREAPNAAAERLAQATKKGSLLMASPLQALIFWRRVDKTMLFRPDNRAQFPSNRESFRSSGERLIKLVEESTRLNARAAEKIEQAADLMSDDKTKKA